jgi:hypothetical protein
MLGWLRRVAALLTYGLFRFCSSMNLDPKEDKILHRSLLYRISKVSYLTPILCDDSEILKSSSAGTPDRRKQSFSFSAFFAILVCS